MQQLDATMAASEGACNGNNAITNGTVEQTCTASATGQGRGASGVCAPRATSGFQGCILF
jgi:hypothetical protein